MMRLISACFCWCDALFFFLSANNFCAETVCMKASHQNFKTKQQAVDGDKICVCFASFGPRSLKIGLQRVSNPSTTTLKLTKATTRPRDPRSSPISKFLVTSCQSFKECQSLSLGTWLFLKNANRYLWAHGSFVLCPNKANKASAQCT